VDVGQQMHRHQEQQHCSRKEKKMKKLKMKKISSDAYNCNVIAQGCKDDCVEKDVWVGKTNGNDSGCVIYSTVYSGRTTTLL